MAKKKRRNNRVRLSQPQRLRFGQDLESLGLMTDKQDVEIRFDVQDPEVKQKIDALARYGLVRVRQHGGGQKLWRVALTHDGEEVAREHLTRVQRQRREKDPVVEDRPLTDEELAKRTDARNTAFSRLTRPSRGGLSQINLPADPVYIGTETLRVFQARAATKNLSRLLTQEVLDSLDLNGRHRIRDARRHTSDDGKYTNVRAIMDLQVRQSLLERDRLEVGNVETEQVVVDFTNKDWDMLMVPYHASRREALMQMGGSRPGTNHPLYIAAPKWTATHSYGIVHEIHSFYQGHVSAYERTGWHGPFGVPNRFGQFIGSNAGESGDLRGAEAIDFITHPRSLMNAQTHDYLHKAHPLVIDPEWVEMQEDWTANEAWAYAQRAVLPFDPLYLDFMGPGGRMAEIDVLGHKALLAGCLLYTDQNTGRVVVQPIGGRDFLDISQQTGVLAGAFPYEQCGRVVIGGRCEYGTPFEAKIDNHQLAVVEGLYVVPQAYVDESNEGIACDLPSYTEQAEMDGQNEALPFGVEGQHVPGYFELPLTPDEALLMGETDEDRPPATRLMVWNATVGALAIKSLSMLSLIDNEHVELREASMTRPERRSVERDRKKGREHGVASEIVVVRKGRYVNKTEDEGGAREYSHQWRVRRHEQHHGPHTRVYQARPDLARPCGRCGSCRRFIIESYIKGPADRPLKERKTYVFQGQQ